MGAPPTEPLPEGPAVYVDEAIWPYGRMVMCHMFADHVEDLHEMAARIGIARRWFQDKPGFPHYDICKSKRQAAVEKGAVEVSSRTLVRIVKRHRSRNESPISL
jgi:hypothetical protein